MARSQRPQLPWLLPHSLACGKRVWQEWWNWYCGCYIIGSFLAASACKWLSMPAAETINHATPSHIYVHMNLGLRRRMAEEGDNYIHMFSGSYNWFIFNFILLMLSKSDHINLPQSKDTGMSWLYIRIVQYLHELLEWFARGSTAMSCLCYITERIVS